MDAFALAQAQENHTRIRRTELLETIRENRDKHEAEYTKAIEGWGQEVVKALQKHADHVNKVLGRVKDDVASGKPIKKLDVRRLYPDIPVRPESHVKDYDVIIRRLGMSIDEEIFITHSDFEKFVLDQWSWKELHTSLLNSYANPGQSDDDESYL